MSPIQPTLPTLVPKQSPLDAETELYWLALALTPGLGPRRGVRLVENCGDVRSIFSASRGDLESSGLSGSIAQTIVSGCMFDDAVEQQSRSRALGCHVIPFQHPAYPEDLRGIIDPPLLLFAKGNMDLLHDVSIAVVGTRRPSSYGKAAAAKLSAELAGLNICVISGMARGVDTISHRATLDANGKTIAVFGCGLDVIYPTENKGLAEEIASKGLLLSEFAFGLPAYPQNFPLRNRIVSGIARGVLVVEGAQYSGSSITARLAIEQGRDVFAVPGNITSRMSWGPNLLIKQGAVLVQDASDILNHLPSQFRIRLYRQMHDQGEARPLGADAATAPPVVDPVHHRVLVSLRTDEGMLLDQLMEEIPNMSSSEVVAALFQLEMDGLVKQDVGQRYIRVWC